MFLFKLKNLVSNLIIATFVIAVVAPAPATASAVVEDDLRAEETPLASNLSLGLQEELPEGVFKLAFSDGNTNQIINRLHQAESECGQLPAEYRADCLSQGFRSAEAATRSKPDYQTAGGQLSSASRSISSLVNQNADPAAKPIVKGGKRYRAVKKSAIKSVNAKAAAIIAEAETKLLRSAGSGHRKVHFQRIAQAIGSTKKILRS